MKTLLTTTAMSIAMGVSTLAFAETTFTQNDSTSAVELTITSEASAFLTPMTEALYRGDFLSTSNAELNTLTAFDLYTGMGACKMASVRSVA